MKECVAMLLAGGQGSRLYALTQSMAKPAVYFGGKYRIIDFPLSNCINSGIDTVGVLTQYQPLELNEYLGNGQPWDLDRMYGGVHVLPPYQKATGSDWYKGTANAIYQNINFIERYDPEYVLILSGDHIYKMDYAKMLAAHKEKGADITIAVLDVPKEEASRFGIMTCDETGRIVKFTEKPKNPDSTLASMGIYIFTWEKLKKYLIEDEANPESENDFGKNIITSMLADQQKLYAYNFEGYWKDVGTIDSLWESNMDLLDPNVPFDVWDKEWKIYSRTLNSPPQYVSDKAVVENSMISEGCEVEGTIDFSVLFQNVVVEEGATVTDSIIMPGTVVKKGAVVEYAIIGEGCTIEEGAHIGERPEAVEDSANWGIAVIGNNLSVCKNAKVAAKAMVYNDIKEEK
ncbi:MAG: glucose-1-phosphate adenylyltransferase [Oscillospiraceae bacterium]|nr:glucose-1-phosphate adenylyltransferase [Oscillospiraceae bacterium]MBQ5312475.1 glucose-1-phosphate adenylyltransferase [Oscillospiraceae bacterium]MBQ5324367.1 glucose-1-phosphate adenylyltransferase [Oscillospiraceae bacterium]